MPALGTGVPALGIGVPGLGTGVPASGTTVPALGMAVPALGIAVPALGTGVPTLGSAVPTPGTTVPSPGSAVPVPLRGYRLCPLPLPYPLLSMEDLQVLVVSGDPLARTGLALLLRDQEGVTVSRQVAPDEDWPALGDDNAPDVILWDLGFDLRSGIEELRSLGPAGPPVVTIVVDETDAREALAAGARGALSRHADGDRLTVALRAVALGLVVLDEDFAADALRDAPAVPQELTEPLTPREREVLQLLAQGLPNKLIAQRLGVSEHTAKFHVNAILGKLGVQSRSEAIVQAVRLGLVLL
jgi:two-component system nitrate/nitrite response regulator NarL